MISIQLIRTEPDKVKDGIAKKNYDPTVVDAVLEADKLRLDLLQKVEDLRKARNEISKKPTPEEIAKAKQIKEELQQLEPQLEEAEVKFKSLLLEIPRSDARDCSS